MSDRYVMRDNDDIVVKLRNFATDDPVLKELLLEAVEAIESLESQIDEAMPSRSA